MDKEILRLPSDPGSESRSIGAPRTLPFQNCSTPSYHVVNSTIGSSTTAYSQFLPTSTAAHSLPPPPGLPHPGLTNIYQFQPNCPPHPQSYQNLNYTPEMPGAPASPAHLAGHYPAAPSVKSAGGQYHNGFSIQNGGVPAYPGYPYFGNVHQAQQTIPPNNSVSQQHFGGPFNTAPYDRGTYQQPVENLRDFTEQLNLLTGSKNSLGSYEDGNSRSEFMQHQLKPAAFQETNSGIHSAPYSLSKNETKTSISNGVGRVMNPIIENLVGSMSMCNGTYTHFGPSAATTNKGLNGQSELLNEKKQHMNYEPDQKTLFSKIAISPMNQQKEKDLEGNASVKQEAVRQMQMSPDQDTVVGNTISSPKNNFNTLAGSEGDQQRSASPRDAESTSRPQTPGKPSYLEVLTKAAMKNAVNSPTRKTSSTSSSPVQSAFCGSTESVPNLAHRKSVDIFTGSTSTTSSSCPSSSSSPATKQRNSISGMLPKGKENVSSSNSITNKKQSSIDRNSASNSPTHHIQHQYQTKGKVLPASSNAGDERKVLSSQNSGSSKGAKSSKKTSAEKLNQFEDLKDEGELEWKTYTSRSRNNNLCNIGNKNSQKRTNSGQNSLEPGLANLKSFDDEDDEDSDEKKSGGGDDTVPERKSGFSNVGSLTSNTGGSGISHSRKQREKEKSRNRREGRNCVSRRLESLVYMWLAHMISALTWLWSLITDVASLSASLGVSLMQDLYGWAKTKALPNVSDIIARWRKAVWQTGHDIWTNGVGKLTAIFARGGPTKSGPEEASNQPGIEIDKNILSLLGPERNIMLPANGDEALKRLLSVKGQDPYSILGVRSDSNEETIRRYYKRQAVLVHPDKNLIVGAEEAFKILARAFEMVGDPLKRAEYHQKLMEAQAKEKFCGEIGNLLEQLRKKMEAASSTIRCTKCNSRHKKNITDRPLFAARYCSQCRIHHGAREGELWAERKGWFGIAWNYFACMDGHVWEINEWARCQKQNLKHIKADAHCVMYRLVAGGNNQNHNNQNCNGTGFEEGAGSEADEWDSLINNLYKSPAGSTFGKTTGVPGKTGCCSSSNVNNNSSSSASQTAGKRRKGKRNK